MPGKHIAFKIEARQWRKYADKFKTKAAIARHLGVGEEAVYDNMKRHGVVLKPFSQRYTPKEFQELFDQHQTPKEMARQIGCSVDSIYDIAAAYGTDYARHANKRALSGYDDDTLRIMLAQNATQTRLAKKLRVNWHTLTNELRRRGISTGSRNSSQRFGFTHDDLDRMTRMGMSAKQIASVYGASERGTALALIRLDVEPRDVTQPMFTGDVSKVRPTYGIDPDELTDAAWEAQPMDPGF